MADKNKAKPVVKSARKVIGHYDSRVALYHEEARGFLFKETVCS